MPNHITPRIYLIKIKNLVLLPGAHCNLSVTCNTNCNTYSSSFNGVLWTWIKDDLLLLFGPDWLEKVIVSSLVSAPLLHTFAQRRYYLPRVKPPLTIYEREREREREREILFNTLMIENSTRQSDSQVGSPSVFKKTSPIITVSASCAITLAAQLGGGIHDLELRHSTDRDKVFPHTGCMQYACNTHACRSRSIVHVRLER